MKLLAALLLALPLRLFAWQATPAADLAARVREAGLEPEECYHVRDLSFSKEDIRFYLTDGFLIFGKSVDGRRYSAVFVADNEGGEAEMLLFPPTRSERASLARNAGTPNLNEHFTVAVMVFTDGTYEALSKEILNLPDPRKSPERGLLLSEAWNPVLRNLVTSFETRLMRDSLSAQSKTEGFFYSAITGDKLGNYDVMYDPQSREQIVLGRVGFRDDVSFFDTWTSFQALSFRKGVRSVHLDTYTLSNYRIEATLQPDLSLRVLTRVTLTPTADGARLALFNLSSRMRLTAASVNGVPAEFFQRDTVRESLLRGGDSVFLLLFSAPLERGKRCELEFENQGSVIHSAGNSVYFVDSRDNWYPSQPWQFSQYDVTFHYPKGLDLVVAGEPSSESAEGDWKVVRRKMTTPVRLLGFNIGDYEHVSLARDPYHFEVYANKKAEPSLQPRDRVSIAVLPPGWDPFAKGARPPQVRVETTKPPPPNPAARLGQLASEIASAFEFMASSFGPAPVKTLTVSPIPGAFGQGFPGLVYLSTVSYLSPEVRPAEIRGGLEQTWFSEILQAHEVAHQWWGNVVAAAGEQDGWVMEALANYSALMYLEKRRGPRVLDTVLVDYRKRLLAQTEEKTTTESVGPIIWGVRLLSSSAPDAWRTITYEKGSWIIHMLRRRMGDQRFLAMLGDLLKRYRQTTLSTEQFRALAAQFAPPGSPDPKLETFFENWVYATGIPTLKMEYSVHGKAPALKLSVTVSQSDVDESFSADVPVEVQVRGAKPATYWVRTESEPVTVTVPLKVAPTSVLLDPAGSVLAVKK